MRTDGMFYAWTWPSFRVYRIVLEGDSAELCYTGAFGSISDGDATVICGSVRECTKPVIFFEPEGVKFGLEKHVLYGDVHFWTGLGYGKAYLRDAEGAWCEAEPIIALSYDGVALQGLIQGLERQSGGKVSELSPTAFAYLTGSNRCEAREILKTIDSLPPTTKFFLAKQKAVELHGCEGSRYERWRAFEQTPDQSDLAILKLC